MNTCPQYSFVFKLFIYLDSAIVTILKHKLEAFGNTGVSCFLLHVCQLL